MQTLAHTKAIITLIETLPINERDFVLAWFSSNNLRTLDFEPIKNVESPNTESEFWLSANSDALNQIWDAPSENVWDTIYKNHEINGRL